MSAPPKLTRGVYVGAFAGARGSSLLGSEMRVLPPPGYGHALRDMQTLLSAHNKAWNEVLWLLGAHDEELSAAAYLYVIERPVLSFVQAAFPRKPVERTT